ncbi:MAG: beta strand repeat-containing protein [Microgenomates group bacterium]
MNGLNNGRGSANDVTVGRKCAIQSFMTVMLWVFACIVAITLAVASVAAPANAQSNDWVANINDVGFDPTIAGAAITYQIAVDNSTLTAAPATTIGLDIPVGLTFTGVTGAITGCTPAPAVGPATVVCSVPALAADGRASGAITVQTSTAGTHTVTISIPTLNDPDVSNNVAAQATTVVAGANMQLQLSGPASVMSGATLNYLFTATNLGPNTATDETVSFPIPTGLANVVPPAGCTLSGSTYSCVIAGPIAVNGSATLAFSGQVIAGNGSTVSAIANIAGTTPADPNTSNNTATLNTSVTAGSDVTIAKSRSPVANILVGDTVRFTLSPSYTGDVPNTLTVTDTVPAAYSVVSAVPAGGSGWSCSVVANTVTCTKPTGSVAGQNVLLGDIVITTTAIAVGTPENLASVSSAGAPADPVPANNSATDGGATITAPYIDLAVYKSGPSPATAVVGESFDYYLAGYNNGNGPFYGTVVLTDQIPAGLTITSISLNPGQSCSPAVSLVGPATLVCTTVYTQAAPLLPGQWVPSIVTSAVATSASTSLQNTLTISSPDGNLPDDVPANDTTTYGMIASAVGETADLSIVKTRSLATLPSGDIETFTLEIVNSGPVTATSVYVEDYLTGLVSGNAGPTGQGFVTHSFVANLATGTSCNNVSNSSTARQFYCNISALPVCTPGVDCPIVTIEVRPGGEPSARSNTATVVSDGTADTDRTNNASTVNYSVTAQTDVTVTKSGAPSPAIAGQNVTYVVTASNLLNGMSSANNVTITDTLPSDLTFISATPSAGTCGTKPTANSVTSAINNQLVCNLGTVANGGQQTVTVVVSPTTVTRGTTITNAVVVSTTTPESSTANNSASVGIPVQDPSFDLFVNKTESVDPVAVGDTTDYTVAVTNLGPSAIENVVMTDTLPPSRLGFVSHVVPSDGSCDIVPTVNQVGGTLRCSFATLAAGATRNIVVTMRGAVKGVATNTATVTSNESVLGFDTITSNNTDAETTTVRTRADLEVVSKVAAPNPIDLRESFEYTILVRNNTGGLLAEADNAVLTDTLPAGMELTGQPTASVVTGSISTNTCTGAAGSTSFTCDFGTFSSGGSVNVTVPVRVTDVTSLPQNYTNTASITTSSLDTVPANNSNSGGIAVRSSSISGTVFLDFNNGGTVNVGDSGISGVTMTLSGTAFDGTVINATTTTDSSGNYSFAYLARGTYSISRGAPSQSYVTDGADTVGTEGGTLSPSTAITSIALPRNVAATGYLFSVVPNARVGIAKSVLAGPTVNYDGSFNVTFRIRVRNFSLEALNTLVVNDTLAGSAPGFGSYESLGNPAFDVMTQGAYTILSAPSGNCGSTVSGFTGSGGSTTVASGFTLAAGSTCNLNFEVRVNPTRPLPALQPSGGRYNNQATVSGVGALSGQTQATNAQLTDLSDNGTNSDANGNEQGNEAGENDPTPVTPIISPSVTLVKMATPHFSTPAVAGDTIDYRFTVTNTGNVRLFGLTLSDLLPGLGLTGGPITVLDPGASDTATFTGVYTLTQADVDAGEVVNQATIAGVDPYNTAVSDDSGTTATNDLATTTPISSAASIALLKVADDSAVQNPAAVGDVITYAFTVQNTGNVTLTNVRVSDPKLGLTLLGGPIATLLPGQSDTLTYTADYPITQADIDAYGVTNTATATGTPPAGPDVTDLSGTSLTNDTPTNVVLPTVASITLIKASTTARFSSPVAVGDLIDYTFTVQNTGNLTLSTVTLTDTLPGIVISGGPISSLAPGTVDTGTFTAQYALTQADIDAGEVVNTATVHGNPPTGPEVNDVSGTDATNDIATVTTVPQSPSIALVKLDDASGLSSPAVAGDQITYNFIVTNNGNVTLNNVTLTDDLVGIVLTGAPIASLAPGAQDSTTFAATYTLTQADVDAGEVVNTALITGTPLVGPDVTDDAGTAVNNDLPVITDLTASPRIRLLKTADLSALANPPQVGDMISYAFTVRNSGNVTLTGVTLTDPLLGANVLGGPIATLAPGISDSTTFTATYALTQADIDAGTVLNQATTTGTDPNGTNVSDLSGTSLLNDLPTTALIDRDPQIALVKQATTAFSAPVAPGDLINYTFSVTNTGNVTLTNATLSDLLPGMTLMGGPIGTLSVGGVDTTTFTGRYALTQADIDAGRVDNTATVSADTPNPTRPLVTDDSGTSAANDIPTTVIVPQAASLTLDKTYTTSGNPLGAVAGDVFTYTFTITNTGNTTLTNLTLADPLPGLTLTGGPIASLAPGAVDTATFVGTYTVSMADLAVGFVNNTAAVTGNYTDGSAAPHVTTAQDSVSAVVMTVEAVPEVFPSITTDGGNTTSMLASDLAAGQAATLTPGSVNSVILTVTGTSNPGISLNTTTGIITLTPGLPAGDYTVTYQICSALVPTVCDTTTETVNQAARPSIEVTKTQVLTDDGNGIIGVGDTITYTIIAVNTGNTPLTNVVMADTMTAAVSGAPLTLDTGPTFVSASAGSTAGDLLIGESATYSATYVLTIEAVSGGGVSNAVTASGLPVYGPDVPGTPVTVSDVSDDGIDTDGNVVDDPTVLLVDPIITTSGLTLTKTTPQTLVQRGGVVPYVITVRNANVAVVGIVNVTDTLPANFSYVAGSATLNGSSVVPTVAGPVITVSGVPVPPLSTITLTLQVRILTGAAAGSHTNVVDIYDPATGVKLAPQAAATVRIEPEPVFDCGDVIGKVYDDVNRNGYQDGPAIGATTIPEPGLPGVRVVGVDGTIITTDAYGRFHVPCAALPASHGSNFVLKVDARSLPSGYRLTTENPRVMRLTKGKLTEMNFGAAITRVARVDLNANGFDIQDGTIRLVGGLAKGVDQLLARIIDTPTNVRLVFHLTSDASRDQERQAVQKMAAVERYIRLHWDKIDGRYKLVVEKTIVRAK